MGCSYREHMTGLPNREQPLLLSNALHVWMLPAHMLLQQHSEPVVKRFGSIQQRWPGLKLRP